MKFNSWMLSEGLSTSSAHKYRGAIEGALSEWATAAGLIQSNLISITNKSEFDAVALKIRELPIFRERNSTGHNMYGSALSNFSKFLATGTISTIEEDIEAIVANQSIGATEKSQLINARIGQGIFRAKLLEYWGKCAVTGVTNPALLLASHIKPWSKCNNEERMDQFNGLLLSPNLDRAFDQGLVSFSADGHVLVSPKLGEAKALGIHEGMQVKLAPQHRPYMEFHRSNVFRAPNI